MKPLSKTIAAPEHIEQVRLVNWFRDNFKEPDYIIFAVPNGGKRGGAEAERLRKEGVKKGVSDLIIVTHNKIIFLEMKNAKGKLSKEQISFNENIEYLGFISLVAYSATDASEKIMQELLKTTWHY